MKKLDKDSPPIIFLAFANDQESYLRGLTEEESIIRKEFKAAEKEGICKVIYEASVTIDDIYDTFQEHQGQIAIFHYAGHANSYQLLLEAADGSKNQTVTGGLLEFLGSQKGLQFVFLNGCSTERQATDLIEAGVPIVIGTTEEIPDELARNLAGRFYSGLGNDLTLKNAWVDVENYAKDKLENFESEHRAIGNIKKKSKKRSHFPWRFLVKNGHEKTEHWSLSLAANDPLFGLPNVPEKFHLPEEPFRYLEWFKREHADVFFGRGHDIKRLHQFVTNKNTEPVLLLYGQTGVGKSSLLEAGILPRLEDDNNIIYLRHHIEKDYLTLLKEELNAKDGETLLEIWNKKEANDEKPLHIILDQLEETITRPLPNHPNELDELLAELKSIFIRKDLQPKGKFILSYRKEYHPEINDKIRDLGIPKAEMFIKQIDKLGIIEATEGLSRNPKTNAKYNLIVEPELPKIIADDLLTDKASSIAPVLQILLSKMWERIKGDEERLFTVELYHSLRKEGYLLSDFLKEKFKELEAWNPEAVKSGLILDLLYFHTTSKGTANKQMPKNITDRYSHWSSTMDDLLKTIKNKYLLTDAASEKRDEGKSSITLAHDTLAPLVREMFDNSDKPGQKASRIFKNKKEEWNKTKSNELLTAEEVKSLEAGKLGMKSWDDDEVEFFESCKKQIDFLQKRRKRLNLMLIGSMVAIMLLAVFGFVTQRQKNKTLQSNILLEKGQNLLSTDPTKALEKFKEAHAIRQDATTESRLIDVKRDYVFYEEIQTFGFDIAKAAFSSDGKYCALYNKANETELTIFDLTTKKITKTLKGPAHAISSFSFSPNNKKIVAGSFDKKMYLWDIAYGDNPKVFSATDSTDISYIEFSSDGTRILSRDKNYVRLWDANTQIELSKINVDDEVSSVGFFEGYIDKGKRIVMLGNQSGECQFTDIKSGQDDWYTNQPGNPISTSTSSSDYKFVVGMENGDVLIGLEGNLDFQNINQHSDKVTNLQISNDRKLLLSASNDQTAIIWDLTNGRKLRTLLGHETLIKGIGLVKNKLQVFSCTERRILKWNLPNDLPIKEFSGELGINDIVVSKSRNLAIVGTNKIAIDSFNLSSFHINKSTEMQDAKIKALAISNDEKSIAFGSNKGEISLMNFSGRSLNENKKIKATEKEIKNISFLKNEKLIIQSDKKVFSVIINSGNVDTISSESGIFYASENDNSVMIFGKDSTATVIDINSKKVPDSFSLPDKINSTCPISGSDDFIAHSKRTIFQMDISGNTKVISNEGTNIKSIFSFQKNEKTYLGILTKENILVRDLNGNLIKRFFPNKKITKIFADPRGNVIIGTHRSDVSIWKLD